MLHVHIKYILEKLSYILFKEPDTKKEKEEEKRL